MAAFVRLFDAAALERVDDVTVRLDDPAPATVVAPPVAARHAGHEAMFVRLRPQASGTHDIVAPSRAVVRRVRLDPATPLPGAITDVLEISVLPFDTGIGATLRASRHGAPTFYIAPFGELAQTLPPPEIDDAFVEAGMPIVSLTGGEIACIGVLFQDGVTLAPASALAIIGDAIEAAGDVAGATAWRAQLGVFGPQRTFHVRRHDGSLLEAATQIDIELRDDAGTPVASGTIALGVDGDLESALAAAPIGALASLFSPPANHHVAVRWRGEPLAGEALPVHALHDAPDSAPPGAFLALPQFSTPHATMLVLDVANWFPPLADGLNVGRFHTDSRIEPLVDGIPAYKALIADLREAVHRPADGDAQFRLHLAAWALLTFNLEPENDGTDIVTLATNIRNAGGSVLVLPTRFLNIHDESLDDTRYLIVLLLIVLGDATMLGMLLTKLAEGIFDFDAGLDTNDWVTFSWLALPTVAAMLLEAGAAIGPIRTRIIEGLEGLVENALGTMEALNALPNGPIARQSSNPARIADNPLAPLYGSSPFFGAEDDCDQFSVYHNKVQMVRRRRDPVTGDEFVAYLGGIDINPNRLDTPGHQIGSPYHDVHARITGPVVADVFVSFYERWIRDAGLDRTAFEADLPPARPDDMPRHDAKHIARIGRTYPKVTPPLEFAPDGDRAIFDTLVAAIGQARDYIYIEDQYFAPHDVYIDALRAAAGPSRCKRLLVTVPDLADQAFADLRRRHVLDALSDAWGSRMLVGYPQRRPRLLRSDRFASRGRAWLASACGPGDGDIFVAPPARVISAPFWLWVDGELMLARDVTGPVEQEGVLATRIAVERGAVSGRPRWGAHPRPHNKNAPVTFSQAKGIYIHAKCMMIDDVFVSIGSANLNRRGFFSDGEINVFAIPEQLRSAPDNPARALRTALWAEHLGIAPAMGASLLRDPIASFERFFHPHLAGNRYTPLSAGDIQPDFGVADAQIFPLAIVGLIASLAGAAPSVVLRRAWNLAVDPTTDTDPAPSEGPV